MCQLPTRFGVSSFLRVIVFMHRFDPNAVKLVDLPARFASRLQAETRPKVSLSMLARFIYVAGKIPGVRIRQPCLTRAFCLAEFWHASYGTPVVNVGVASKTAGSVSGHVWISIDGDVLWKADRLARQAFQVLLSDQNGICYWFSRDGHQDLWSNRCTF